jgi:hypothetical protein
MALHRPWAVEMEEDIATLVRSEAHVFPRHAHALPRHLQDVWADGVIMTCKTMQTGATPPCYSAPLRHVADRSLARRAEATLGYDPIGRSYAADRSPRVKTDGTGHAMRHLCHHYLVPTFNALAFV